MKLSSLSIAVIALVYLISFRFYEQWTRTVVGGGDAWGYYVYLPAAFIHGDLATLDRTVAVCKSYRPNAHQSPENPLGVMEAHVQEDGRQVIKYTMGLALLLLPFFLIAHALSALLGLPLDGFAPLYIYWLYIWSIFCTLSALLILRNVLRRYFEDQVVAWVLLALGLATNVLYFTVYNSPMAHIGLLLLYAVLLWLTIRFYESPTWRRALGIGLVSGWITLIRPTEIINICIPLLWGLTGSAAWRDRLQFMRRKAGYYVLAIAGFLAMGLPQLIYWHWLTGDWLHFSYGGESFDFSDPHILEGMFSFKNGWLVYTPIMGLSLIGCFFLFRHREALWPILCFIPVHIYVTYSWWCWNYINGFGSRPMIDAYVLLSFPLAYLLQWAFHRRLGKTVLWVVLAAAIALTNFQLWQIKKGILWSEDNNLAYYLAAFGKTKVSASDIAAYDLTFRQPDPADLEWITQLHYNGYEDTTGLSAVTEKAYRGNFAFPLDRNVTYSPGYSAWVDSIGLNAGDWIGVRFFAQSTESVYSLRRMAKMAVAFQSAGQSLYWWGLRIENKLGNNAQNLWSNRPGVWEEVQFFVPVPKGLPPDTRLKVHGWHPHPHTVYLDELEVTHWRRRE